MTHHPRLTLPPLENRKPPTSFRSALESIPLLGYFIRASREIRPWKARADTIKAQLRSRPRLIEQPWMHQQDLAEALQFFSTSLKEHLGLNPRQLLADDPLATIFASDWDDLVLLCIHGDLEDWLGHPLDPDFFEDQFSLMTFRQAVEWLAQQKIPAAN